MLLLICSIVVYIVMAVCACIPLCLVARTSSSQHHHFSEATERIISFCNCMASGVFIAMCFLGLLPYAKDKTIVVLEELCITTDFPVTEFIVVLGFFLIMTVEQMVLRCQHHKKQKLCQAVWSSSSQAATIAASADLMTNQQTYFVSNSSSTNMEDDNESCTQLLADITTNTSSSPIEVLSPEGSTQSQLYQNVPMVLLNTPNQEGKTVIKVDPCIPEHYHGQQLDALFQKQQQQPCILHLAGLFISISIHSVFEGVALGLQNDKMHVMRLFFAILFHEALVSLSVGIILTRQKVKVTNVIKFILIFCLSVPVGIMAGLLVQQTPGTGGLLASALLQSLATGIFIHVTFLELVPSEFLNQKDRLVKVAFHFLGFLTLAVVTVTMGAHH